MAAKLVGGQQLEECPGCGKTRAAVPGPYVCGSCGTKFRVVAE